MEKKATAVSGAVVIERAQICDGVSYLSIELNGADLYAAFVALPAVLEYDGKLHGKSAWNSDRGLAYYRSDMKLAKAPAAMPSRTRELIERLAIQPDHSPEWFQNPSCRVDLRNAVRAARAILDGEVA